jgi:hypothetical protein
MVVHIKGKNEDSKVKYLSGDIVPQVRPLFIDKLYITLHIPADLHSKTIDGFQKAKEVGWGKVAIKTGKYTHNLKLDTDSPKGSEPLIQCFPPPESKCRFFRIEFNPSKTNINILKTIIDIILPGGYTNLINAGIVTRIDLTVDADYINSTDIIAECPKIKVVKHYAKNGSIESKYLGAASSDKQFLLYDKPAEIVEKNKKKSKGFKTSVPTHKQLRIEYKLKSSCTLQEIYAVSNPFLHLTMIAIYPGYKSEETYDPQWTLFLSACRFEGKEKALSHLNSQDRVQYVKRLKLVGRTDWWKPEEVWQGLPNAISLITNVKGYNPPLTLLS